MTLKYPMSPITSCLKIGCYEFRNVKLPPVWKTANLRQTINHFRLPEGKRCIILRLYKVLQANVQALLINFMRNKNGNIHKFHETFKCCRIKSSKLTIKLLSVVRNFVIENSFFSYTKQCPQKKNVRSKLDNTKYQAPYSPL